MGLFSIIEGAACVLQSGGVYRQAEVYQRDGGLYAKHGSGFIRLYVKGTTSVPKTVVETLHLEEALFVDEFGRLTINSRKGHPILSGDQRRLEGPRG